MKFIWFVIGILATSIVVFNNIRQLYLGTNNINDILSFSLAVIGVIVYYVHNQKNF